MNRNQIPWAGDQVQVAGYVRQQAIKSSAPSGSPHYLSALKQLQQALKKNGIVA